MMRDSERSTLFVDYQHLSIFDTELECCKLHVEACRKKRLLAKQLDADSEENRKLAEERAAQQDADSGLLAKAAARPRRDIGINMDIPDKAPSLPPPCMPCADPPTASPATEMPAAPVKVAAWAAAKSGINQQKARDAALDTSNYVDPDEVRAPPARARARARTACSRRACRLLRHACECHQGRLRTKPLRDGIVRANKLGTKCAGLRQPARRVDAPLGLGATGGSRHIAIVCRESSTRLRQGCAGPFSRCWCWRSGLV